MRSFNKLSLALASILFFGASPSVFAHAEKEQPKAQVKTVKVVEGVYVLYGQGGNIGLSIGDDGAYLIDDQYAPMSDSIKAAVAQLTDQPVRFVINTHWHGDHTGGNANMAETGSIVVSHDNVRTRMAKGQEIKAIGMTFEAAEESALPVVTYKEAMSLHLNGDDMRIYHVENAHTDGDSIVFLKDKNVLHMGDTFFNIGYPFIDLSSGGSIDGYIRAMQFGADLANDDTKIIPGHGLVTDKKVMQGYIAMLKDLRSIIGAMKQKGMSLEQVQAAKPSARYDEDFGKGFINPQKIVEFIYGSI